MSDATLTTTPHLTMFNSTVLNALVAADLKFEFGKIVWDGGNYSTSGISWTPETIDPDDLLYIHIEGNAGWQYSYDRDNEVIEMWNGTTEQSATAVSYTTYYFAVGKK